MSDPRRDQNCIPLLHLLFDSPRVTLTTKEQPRAARRNDKQFMRRRVEVCPAVHRVPPLGDAYTYVPDVRLYLRGGEIGRSECAVVNRNRFALDRGVWDETVLGDLVLRDAGRGE